MDYKLYLTDPGILKKNKKYYYNSNGLEVTDQKNLERLDKIYIPPAWKNVWYASNAKCHIQAHGVDIGGKKQYMFSQEWTNNSKYSKYNRMKRFVKDIKTFKNRIRLSSYSSYENNRDFLIKLLLNLLIDTHIRVGNEIYAENNGTYGLTTLRQKHLIFKENYYYFSFLGKSNKFHEIQVPDRYNIYLNHFKLNNGNSPLFVYDKRKIINSEELNDYIKTNMGNEYTCKDFRTYSANILFIKAFLKNTRNCKLKSKKIILKCIDSTAELLGHTRNISRKSYISTNLLDYCYDSFDKAVSSTPEELLVKVWD